MPRKNYRSFIIEKKYAEMVYQQAKKNKRSFSDQIEVDIEAAN